jgi:hypothetical protein
MTSEGRQNEENTKGNIEQVMMAVSSLARIVGTSKVP